MNPVTAIDPAASQYQAFALAVAAWRAADPKTRGPVPKLHQFKVDPAALSAFATALVAWSESGGVFPKITDFAQSAAANTTKAPATQQPSAPAKPAASAAPVAEIPATPVGQS